MTKLVSTIKQSPEYRRLLDAARAGQTVSLYGLSPVHRAHFAAALQQDMDAPICFVCRDEQASRQLASDFEALCGRQVYVLPGRDFTFHNIEGVSREYEQQRLAAMWHAMTAKSPVVSAPADALMLRTIPPGELRRAAVTLDSSGDYDVTALCSALVASGYTRFDQVEGPGQFALRGGILDIFPSGESHPVRAEFFGDSVDSLGIFDPMTQRRTKNIRSVTVLPAREALPGLAPGGVSGLISEIEKSGGRGKAAPLLRETLHQDAERLRDLGDLAAADRYLPLIYPDFSTAVDFFPKNTVFICSDSPAVSECARGLAHRQGEDITHMLENGVLLPSKSGYSMGVEQFKSAISGGALLLLDTFLSQGSGFISQHIISMQAKQLPSYGGSFDVAVKDLAGYVSLGFTLYALAGGASRAKNLLKLLEDNGLPCTSDAEQAREGVICVLADNLSSGFEYPSLKLAAVCEGRQDGSRRRTAKREGKNRLKSFSDLSPGDLVVHEHHGIGRFVNVERIQADGVWRDYIKIAFSGTDSVYVPATALDLVSKYIGSGEQSAVKLSKLGGAAWTRAKQKAKSSARDLAQTLIDLYSARQSRPGFAFDPDDDWQRSFEEAFPFDETEDQLLCAQEIKSDMQKPFPMDRLLCGDVGFGKTEVAFRAVMKCVLSGKQAAILVPTTVLARQHYLSSLQRFDGYPVKIDMMSRFRTKKQLSEAARRAKNGQSDLLIGTHRILQKDVSFKNLGLLVVDEEQRFGVSHKEAVKQMSLDVDVLTLTATPIPRTLNMALSGIRDMSVLEEAPVGRMPVQTYVLEHDEAVLRDAIRRELSRGGQVYYLHNRIDSIDRTAGRLQQMFPDAVVAVAHGQMGEEPLSDVMSRTYSGDVGILVCTTIIETGLDIPNVNTLIIEDSDHMGLAQLHQIRGRVGRSSRHAYAYFTYRRGKILTEISQKRLSAIREFAEFGSGFKIAMRDLEIRGAGNVLGAEQSGHMMNVGYDMYLRLLDDAARELKGEAPVPRTDCTADILVSAGLPQGYIPDAATRIDLYRRIAMISTREDHIDMHDELTDRFGEPPPQAVALFDIALLRADASRGGIYEISQKESAILFYVRPEYIRRAMAACAAPEYKGQLLLSAGQAPYISLRLRHGADALKAAIDFVRVYSEAGQGDS